ncbi:unknown [Sutterella sp. CAG:351]|nr:unknown [Sutterella sp. CAG:351]
MRRGVSREIRAVKTFAAKTDKEITRFRLSCVRADTGNSRISITVEHRPINRLGNPARCRDERHSDFSSFSFAMRL